MKPEPDKKIYTASILLTTPEKEPVKNGALLIENDLIADIGKKDELLKKYPDVHCVELENKLLMPGLVNTHTHLNMAILRGLAEDLPLREWLDETYRFRQDYLDDETRRLGVRLSLAELIKNGVTTVGDMSFYQNRFIDLIHKSGIRALLYDTIMAEYMDTDRPQEIIDFIDQKHPETITAGAAIHAPYSSDERLLKWFEKEIIKNSPVPYCIHLAETRRENNDFIKKYRKSSTYWLNDYNFLSDRLLAIHCVWLTDNDIKLLASHNSAVSYNPESNMKLGSGIAPVDKFLKSGMRVGLGTDGAASNNDLDLLAEIDSAGKLQKVNRLDPELMTARTLVKMATSGGTEALGMKKTGSLQPGKQADFITIDINRAHLRPIYDVYSLLCYSATGSDVRDVWVAGKQLMREKKLLTLDEKRLIEDINKANYKINTLRRKKQNYKRSTVNKTG